jgi:protein arginine N-methyltransferase 5
MHPSVEAWSFEHPCPLQGNHNTHERFANLAFVSPMDHAAAMGCGYGPVDDSVTAVMAALSSSQSVSALPWTCTGLLGTFTADLYNNNQRNESGPTKVQISTEPHSFSTGMFSWFPLYFPLHTPVRVPPGAVLEAQIWRRIHDRRVWYEWAVQVRQPNPNGAPSSMELLYSSALHNPGGRSYDVAL